MTRSARQLVHGLLTLAVGLVLAAGASTPCAGGEARDYAYLFLQGKITAGKDAGPVNGARVRLLADSRYYEATTDRRGVFVFEHLPVKKFQLEVITPDGRVIRQIEQVDMQDPARSRLRIQLGKESRTTPMIDVADGEMQVEIPAKKPRWKRFWTQLGIFIGVAVVFAL